MIREKQDGEDLVMVAVDRTNAAAGEKQAARFDGNTGKVTANLADNSVLGTALAVSSLRMLTGQGHNLAGAATLTGAKVGDKVVGVSNVTDHVTASASFESTITVADQIQQSAAVDLSAKTIIVVLVAKS